MSWVLICVPTSYSHGSTGILRVSLWGSPMELQLRCCVLCGEWDDFLLTVSPLLLVKWSHHPDTANLGHGHDGTCAAILHIYPSYLFFISIFYFYDCLLSLSFEFSGCYCLVFNLLNPSRYCKKWIILDCTEKDKIRNIEKIYFMVPI